jgi:DNA (cytosine-5)-methyltransferase 1
MVKDQGGDNINVKKGIRAAGFNGWRSVTGTLEYEEDRAPCIQANMPPDVLEQYAVDFGRIADRIQMNPEKAVTLQAEGGGGGAKTGLYCLPIYCVQGNIIDRTEKSGANGMGVNEDVSFTLNATDRHAVAYDCRNHTAHKEISGTLQAKPNGGQSLNYINPVAVPIGIDSEINSLADKMGTMRAHGSGGMEQFVATPYSIKSFGEYEESEKSKTLLESDDITTSDLILSPQCLVRRLTPLECERLQGFPDGWTEYGHGGKQISDSARYKALGNSVAIPCVDFLLSRISEGL